MTFKLIIALACAAAVGAAQARALQGAHGPWSGAAAQRPLDRPSASKPPPVLLATGLGGLWRSVDAFKTAPSKVIDDLVDKVEFVGSDGVAVASGLKVWRSEDWGETWTVALQRSGASSGTFAVTRFAFDEGGLVGMAVGMSIENNAGFGHSFATQDGGKTWKEAGMADNNTVGVGIAALSGGPAPQFVRFALTGLLDGSNGVTVQTTTDLGATWLPGAAIDVTNLTLQNGFDADVFSVDGKGEEVTVVGWSLDGAVTQPGAQGGLNSGVLLCSGDSGSSFTRLEPKPDTKITRNSTFGTTFYALTCAGATTGAPHVGAACVEAPMYAVAGSFADWDTVGYLSRSDDGGTTWSVVYEETHANLRDVAASPTAKGMVCVAGVVTPPDNQQQGARVSCTADGSAWHSSALLPYPKLDTNLWESLSIAIA